MDEFSGASGYDASRTLDSRKLQKARSKLDVDVLCVDELAR